MSRESNPPIVGSVSCAPLYNYGLIVYCTHCSKQLVEPGALLFSPPNQDGLVEKHHFCIACFHKIAGLLAT